ncbi:MAG TPA: hypothetical protein VLW25_02165 [Bryobacteraceae bacterium]|nr:hypothetical protein [Bryobacteraceae bacterium]
METLTSLIRPNNMRHLKLAAWLLLCSGISYGQHITIGVKSGVPLTDAFSDQTTHGVDTIVHSFSESKDFVIGPVIELGLPLGFAVEAEALYRPLNLTVDSTIVPQPTTRNVTDITSWEFPILGKYYFFHTPGLHPYVEAGPIFRAVGSQASYLSKAGAAFGGGVNIQIWKLRIMPELRYSRWGHDATVVSAVAAFPSNVNQAEFLIGIGF